ncbi:hypothetical protein [Zooshikella harenae]|uniref:Uncharacterized protein n=1 Tax=Zooshikella harenae TaxID=2827238 RepID=A0ABS5ZAA9_9GAMM|nr:hypothetical protein [Zooshikella harenae]MBU2710993.1 hypothetical protein [Zooshikella harenae]
MAVLVHITSIEHESSIKRAGIKLGYSNVVFFMPHMKDFLISHQWARELKRSGIKNFAAVDFKIPNDEEIWFGKYHLQHEKMELNKAISLFMNTEDKLGYEFFIERKIEPSEILKVRKIPKPMGWRYQPNAHGKKPCPCPMCLQAGGYKIRNLKEIESESITKAEALEIIATSSDEDALWEAVCRLQGKWKKGSPQFLERLLNFNDEYLLCDLIELLSEYRHPLAKDYLVILAKSSCDDVSELALEKLR